MYKILQQSQQHFKHYNNVIYKTIIINYCESYFTLSVLSVNRICFETPSLLLLRIHTYKITINNYNQVTHF